jgi:hypothetical protein
MAIIVTAPDDIVVHPENENNKRLFLAGGITNCPDWQSEIIEKIKNFPNLTSYNPRRENFPMDDPGASNQQITWEYEKLKYADIIVFWFSRGSLNPIVLYELGMWGNSRNDKEIIIGIDPEYERANDVMIQSSLAGNAEFHFTLDSVVRKIQTLCII